MTLKQKTPMKRTTPLRAKAPMSRTPAKEPKRRQRKCAVLSCRTPFEPRSMTHKTCSPACAEVFIAAEKVKKLKRERQEGLAKLKRRGDYLKEAQRAFNAFIRERDRLAGHPCICCGVPLDWTGNAVDAGHYRSVGSAQHMRFTESNVWAQAKKCNRFGAGRAVDYRLGLIARIGLAAVEAIESDQTPHKWSSADLIVIRDTYRAKLRELQKGNP